MFGVQGCGRNGRDLSIKVRVCVEMAGVAARADKRIGVSVAEYDGYSTTFS